jgi:hypothetical protein
MNRGHLLLSLSLLFGHETLSCATERILDAGLHHLRAGGEREWNDFPAKAEGPALVVHFQAKRNPSEYTLRLRQLDVRQTWRVLLEGKEVGRLQGTEDDTVIYLPVPPGWLVDGENTLKIEQIGTYASAPSLWTIGPSPKSSAMRPWTLP